jgi:hypothetical protein
MVIPTDEEIVIGYDALYLGYLNQPVPDSTRLKTGESPAHAWRGGSLNVRTMI